MLLMSAGSLLTYLSDVQMSELFRRWLELMFEEPERSPCQK